MKNLIMMTLNMWLDYQHLLTLLSSARVMHGNAIAYLDSVWKSV